MREEASAESAGFAWFGGHRIAFVRHDAGADTPIVVMAHGFKSSKVGPSRYFVPLARMLASRGVSTFRFDQAGSGDSSGDFEDSSFLTWSATIEHFVRAFASEGRRVSLLGQSMGGTATMPAAAALGDAIERVALWSPGPMLAGGEVIVDEDDWMEEEGQRVRGDFWREAGEVDFLGCYANVLVPVYAVFGTADWVIRRDEMERVRGAAKPGDHVEIIEGMPHSAWPYELRARIIAETAAFLGGEA